MTALETDMEALEAAMHLFFRTMKRPQRWNAISSRAGLTIDRPGAVILQILASQEGQDCRLHDIANQLGIEAPSVTRKTQELEAAGYLQRIKAADDKRAVSLQLTPAGIDVAQRLWKVQREIISEAVQDWSSDDRQQFIRLFERFSTDIAHVDPIDTTNKERG